MRNRLLCIITLCLVLSLTYPAFAFADNNKVSAKTQNSIQQFNLEQEKMLADIEAMVIVNEHLIPALDKVGTDFENNKIFLPQLIQSANVAQSCFDVIKTQLSKSDNTPESKGKIILATVKGDIHDIGKNIVKVLLDNYGYTVVDLGKDVAPQLIVDTAVKQNISMIGLSALMTTTLKSMEETIKLVRNTAELKNCKILVGGAVLTPEYAKTIGADCYCKDAKEAVDVLKQLTIEN